MAQTVRKLEEILVEAGLVTAEDLERARRRMSERGGRLATHLWAVARIDEKRFAEAVGAALGLPVVDERRLERTAAPRTPSRRAALRSLAIERALLPIGITREPRTVEVAMFDPTDAWAIERLAAICGGAEVKVAVAPRTALLSAIGRTYGREQAGVLGADTAEHILDFEDVTAEFPIDTDHGGSPGFTDPDAPTPPPMILAGRDVRFVRTLLDAIALLSGYLEDRVARRPGIGRELARYTRLVARELGCPPSDVDQMAVAAHLFAVDRALREDSRERGEPARALVDVLGWPLSTPDGCGVILSALTAIADGLPAPWRVPGEAANIDAPLGAQIIAAVLEYLALAAATPDGMPDRGTVNQLLRVTTAPEIIEALGRVLDAERPKESSDVG